MKNKIDILSKKEMLTLIEKGVPQNAFVISFYTPGGFPIRCPEINNRLYSVALHDIDLAVLPDFGLTPETYFPEAPELASLIDNAVSMGMDIICQCDYGQSRSAACAAAILEYYEKSGIQIFADYRYYPNQLVFNKILDALNKAV